MCSAELWADGSSDPSKAGGRRRRLSAAPDPRPAEPPDSTIPTERPSPFTIPTPSIRFAEGEPAQPPPREMAVEHLIHNLTTSADFYERATAAVEAARPSAKPYQTGHRDANAESMQRCFRATPGVERVRADVPAHSGEERTVGTARRVLGD